VREEVAELGRHRGLAGLEQLARDLIGPDALVGAEKRERVLGGPRRHVDGDREDVRSKSLVSRHVAVGDELALVDVLVVLLPPGSGFGAVLRQRAVELKQSARLCGLGGAK
jgi:hypothetical protein